MKWYPVLFLLGAMILIVGTSTEENADPSMGAVDETHVSQITATNLGRFPYQDGEVILFQNQLKTAHFFFTPFPQVEPNLTECTVNEFSGRTELTLVVSLYTTNLFESVKHHINSQNDTCQTENCEVSLLPIQSIRLIQKGLQTPESKTKYTLNSEWQSKTSLLQTVQFIIYTSNISMCESLQNAITSRCRLSDFEVQYSALGHQTEVRTVVVTTGHVANTSMSKQMKSQLHSKKQETIGLTENDYKTLVTETKDQITMNFRTEKGFESIKDSTEIDQLLESELRYMQVPLTEITDPVWQVLYWTPDRTRPDRLSKVLNKLMKQDGMDPDKFRYDYSQADEAMKKNLKLHERQKLDNFTKHLAAQAQEATNTGGSFLGTPSGSQEIDAEDDVHKQYMDEEENLNDDLIHYKIDRLDGMNNGKRNGTAIFLERKGAEKLVRYFSEHVEIQDAVVQPKSMEVIVVKVDLLKSNTKLFSNVIHLNTRMQLNVQPLRCPYEYRNHSRKIDRGAEKYDRLLNIVNNLTDTFDAKYDRLLNIVKNLTSATDAKYDRLLNMVNDSQRIVDAKYDRLLNIVGNLTNIVEKNEQSTNASINPTMIKNISMLTGISCTISTVLVLSKENSIFWTKRQDFSSNPQI